LMFIRSSCGHFSEQASVPKWVAKLGVLVERRLALKVAARCDLLVGTMHATRKTRTLCEIISIAVASMTV
jgi:hypothetical protein